jgi:hypothetical protein
MESRFSELLNPIRDLAKNWDIDLAHSLEEYLEELGQVRFQGGPGGNAGQGEGGLNFAEAALLIQGSAAVYSRKVEYLHALVFQALSHISAQKENSKVRLTLIMLLAHCITLCITVRHRVEQHGTALNSLHALRCAAHPFSHRPGRRGARRRTTTRRWAGRSSGRGTGRGARAGSCCWTTASTRCRPEPASTCPPPPAGRGRRAATLRYSIT